MIKIAEMKIDISKETKKFFDKGKYMQTLKEKFKNKQKEAKKIEKIINPYRAKILSLLYNELSLTKEGGNERNKIIKLINENSEKIYEN